MPFNGSGQFIRDMNWQNDALSGIKIRADRHDTEDNNLAAGLSMTICRDGQSQIINNIPFSGYKITDVGVATSRNEYARFDQVQDGKTNWGIAGGTADALLLTIPYVTALSDGQVFNFRATLENTGAATLKINGLTAYPLVMDGGSGLSAGIIKVGAEYSARYNLANTRFELSAAVIADLESINIEYDNTASGLTADNVQDAIDEMVSDFNTVVGDLGTAAYEDVETVREIPPNSKSEDYTLVLTDGGKHILHPSADTTARTFTIPANASVAFPIGTAITFVNQDSAGVITIAITTDTMRLAGAGTTGSRTLAANGVATALKISATEWIISGVGLS